MMSFGRSKAGWLAALWIPLLLSGCEYFTSEKLGRLKPTLTEAADEPEPIPAEGDAMGGMTAADVVALMERIVRGNQRELDELRALLADPGEENDEEARARDVFQTLDDLNSGLKRERKKAEAEARGDRLADVDRQLEAIAKPWELARERLNLDLRARSLMLERVELLEAGIAHDQRRLQAILATGEPSAILADPADHPPPADEPPPVELPTPAKPLQEPPALDPQSLPLGVPAKPPVDETKKGETKSEVSERKQEKPDAAKDDDAKPAAEPEPAAKKADAPPSKELVHAQRDLQTKSATVQQLVERTITLDARVKSIARSIDILELLAGVARASGENAARTRAYLIDEQKSGKPSVALQAWTKAGDDPIALMDQRLKTTRENAQTFDERHEALVEERGMVEAALRLMTQRARSAGENLGKARETVEALESPFSTHHMLQWLRRTGPPALGTLLVMSLLYVLVTRYSHKIIRIFSTHGVRGTKSERDNRMETLVSVLQNTGGALVLVGGGLTLLGQIGIPVGPLLGGAAVAGVAVAFGAQSLIKDFFYGFMILLENQYKLNDVVKIGDHSGQIEQITLRMTALRDQEGGLHFLPNGSTTSVVNMTHGWSRASFNVRIGIGEDVDRVIALIQELGKELRQDPAFRLMIVDDLNMLGVDNLTESAVTLAFLIKTLPSKQWDVKREFLKRLKKKFDQNGVILPPPVTTSSPT